MTSLPLGRLHTALAHADAAAYANKPQSASEPTTRTPSPDVKRKQFYVNFCTSSSRIATLHQRARPIPLNRGRSRSVPVHMHSKDRARAVDYRDDRSYEALNKEFQSTPPSSDGEEAILIERGRSRSNTVDKGEELDEEHFLDELI